MSKVFDFPTAEEFLEMRAREGGCSVEQLTMHHVNAQHRILGVDGVDAVETTAYDMAVPAAREAFKRAYDAEVAALKRRMKKARR